MSDDWREVRHWAGIWLAGLSWIFILIPVVIVALSALFR